jgi:undecaprenyl-diphosphatase
MLTYFQAIVLGLFQGLTELFPVSSLGHSVILPALFNWHVDEANDFFLIFLVATHLATALALLIFFFEDWLLIVKGLFRSLSFWPTSGTHDAQYAKLGWLLIIGTIPAGLIGLLFQNKLQVLFASPRLAALFLIGNGLMLWGVDKMRRNGKNRQALAGEIKDSENNLAKLTWMQSLKVGLAQCLALIPGFSRTGATMAGGRLVGLSHEAAAYFAFLLATPIIFAAAVLKLPELGRYAVTGSMTAIGPLIAGFAAAFIAAYFSARWLVRYFKTNNLMPFAIYCMAFGAIASVVFLIQR